MVIFGLYFLILINFDVIIVGHIKNSFNFIYYNLIRTFRNMKFKSQKFKIKKDLSQHDKQKRTSATLTRPPSRTLILSAGLRKKKTLPKKGQKK